MEPRRGTRTLADWYAHFGRHELPWRHTRDPWLVLMSEVMLHQTQVARVRAAWPGFSSRFPTPASMAAAGPGAVIEAWGRLGYPRRARRLWEAATIIVAAGWPADLSELPGVGRYTAHAVRVQVDDVDLPAVEVNVRRVVERVTGRVLGAAAAEDAMSAVGRPLRGRDRLLALMDVGASVCTARAPRCSDCPLHRRCATRGPLRDERRTRQAPFAGSFRQRRGLVMAELRTRRSVPAAELDADALTSVVADGLAVVDEEGRAQLPDA